MIAGAAALRFVRYRSMNAAICYINFDCCNLLIAMINAAHLDLTLTSSSFAGVGGSGGSCRW